MSAHNRRPPSGKPKRDGGRPAGDTTLIYGAHAVREALTAGKRKLAALYATANAIARIEDAAKAAGLKPQFVEARELSRRLGEEAVHQGLLLEATGGLILLLDQITDPHNVGAILRTAAAFAVEAIVVTERHSPQVSGVLAKAASGGLEHVEIVSVVNLARAMEELSRHGYTILGLDSEGPDTLETVPLQAPVALALGAEGKGLRRLTRERCASVARLDTPGAIKSLNVSNACAVALSVLRRRLG